MPAPRGNALLQRRRGVRRGSHPAWLVLFVRRSGHLQERWISARGAGGGPRDRILVETDAPFLAPMPYRGKPNASYLIPWTIRLMSEHLSADLDELCQTVRDNTFEAFGAF